MKKTINYCGNCPFSYSDYDDFAIGYSTADICTLSRFLKLKDDCILVSNGDEELKTPNWCPLKTEEFTFGYKEFSTKRQQEIESTKEELEILQNCVEKYEDYDNPIAIEMSNNIQNLYNRLGELQSNENEEDSENYFQTELNENINEIKDQLFKLENAGNKLQDFFNNLDK
jgi:polyhydroxyalkanoate synthesis regulator phasin